ncbi:MAG: hypothetical protein HQL14_08020 [Candidatus Omnitrophica bacterium]|nr:hypothetical protein [Candidatus Omnitrophota bacterium]
MMKISWAIFLCAFFLLRPFVMEYTGFLYPDDDFDYFANATSLAFGQFPSYKNEYLFRNLPSPGGAIGTGMMAAPFVGAFSLLDLFSGSDIVKKRTAQNVQKSWAVFGFIFASVFYFCFSCFLLYWAARSVVGPSFAAWAVILMVICQGMPLYAYRRPVFSHMPEFFLQSVFVYLFIKNELASGKWIKQWWSFVLLGIGAGMIVLTRYNNVLFMIVWPLLFLSSDARPKKWKGVLRNSFCIVFPIFLLVLIFKSWPEAYNHYVVYQGNNVVEKVFTLHGPWQEFVRRLWYVFCAPDWGLIFTAPFLLLGVSGLALLDVPWKKRYVGATLPLLVNFYVINVTGCQGAYYGYRYLIASAFPLFVLPLAFLLKRLNRKVGSWWKWGAVFLALFPVMSMWCYEGNKLVATLPIPTSFFGVIDWSNATYQIAVWKTVLDLKAFWGIVYLGGLQYWHYLLFYVSATSFGFRIMNLSFDMKTLVQVLLIYSLPFIMAWIFRDKFSSLEAFLQKASRKKIK